MLNFFQFQLTPSGFTVEPGLETAAMSPWLVVLAYLIFIYGGAMLLIFVARFFLKKWYRVHLGFKKVILLVSLPKEAAEKKGEAERKKSLQELQENIAVAQTLFSAVGGLHAERGFRPWFLGRADSFSFEIVAEKGLISFYVAAPPKYRDFIEQEIHALYPHANITETKDYNIFSPRGVIQGGYLTLRRHHLYPLKTFKKLEVDPLESLTNSLAKVAASDGAAIQYVVRSAKAGWRKKGIKVAIEMQKGKSINEAIAGTSFWHSFFKTIKQAPSKEEKQTQEASKRVLSAGEQEAQKAIQEKNEQAGMDVNVRIVTCAKDAATAKGYLKNIANAYTQYNMYESGNVLDKSFPTFCQGLIRDFIFRGFREKWGGVLGAQEMASLYHFPLPTTETPNINWLMARKAAPPNNMPKEGLLLGKVFYRGMETFVRIKKEDRRRHVYIVGKSGVGKTVLLANMVKQDIANGEGVAVIDPHGDLVEDILGAVPKERADDVIIFDPSDMERPVGLNMLEVKNEEQKDFAVQEMIAIFYKLFTPEMIGPMFEHNMRNVMLTLMSDPKETGTIAEIPRMFSDPDYQKYWRSKVKDPVVAAFWDKEMAKTSDFHKSEMLGYLISKVGRFVENEMMRNIIGQPRSGFDFREVMDKKKILLVNLAKGKTGEINSELLGMIIVSKLQMAAMARADLPESERHDFYLYIDEFQNFITDSIATILSEARKYRLNLIIAHQYMGQLVTEKNTKIRDAVLGNAGTMITFRIGVEDAEVLAKEFAPVFNEYDLINTEQYTAYIKLLIENASSRPFSMQTIKPEPGDLQLAASIKELSRLKFGRDRGIVEAEIMERSQLSEPGGAGGLSMGEAEKGL
ncbi:MAG: type IV secretion system DNA-binding domain-containing protein [bacterium]|nr:type IV secretion system DNA-binding domain-containing protein [bacterium]